MSSSSSGRGRIPFLKNRIDSSVTGDEILAKVATNYVIAFPLSFPSGFHACFTSWDHGGQRSSKLGVGSQVACSLGRVTCHPATAASQSVGRGPECSPALSLSCFGLGQRGRIQTVSSSGDSGDVEMKTPPKINVQASLAAGRTKRVPGRVSCVCTGVTCGVLSNAGSEAAGLGGLQLCSSRSPPGMLELLTPRGARSGAGSGRVRRGEGVPRRRREEEERPCLQPPTSAPCRETSERNSDPLRHRSANPVRLVVVN